VKKLLDPNIEKILTDVGNEYNLPRSVWFPIVMYESGGNPLAQQVTDKEDSRGLFQVNTMAHPDANSMKLFDPEYNARYQMPELSRVYEKGLNEGLTGVELTKYVARYGQRPQWTETVSSNIDKFYLLSGADADATTPDAMQVGFWDNLNPLEGFQPAQSFTYIFLNVSLLVILVFALYYVFIKNTLIEETGKGAVKLGKRIGTAVATSGVSEAVNVTE
jgi:hypothetical protein